MNFFGLGLLSKRPKVEPWVYIDMNYMSILIWMIWVFFILSWIQENNDIHFLRFLCVGGTSWPCSRNRYGSNFQGSGHNLASWCVYHRFKRTWNEYINIYDDYNKITNSYNKTVLTRTYVKSEEIHLINKPATPSRKKRYSSIPWWYYTKVLLRCYIFFYCIMRINKS